MTYSFYSSMRFFGALSVLAVIIPATCEWSSHYVIQSTICSAMLKILFFGTLAFLLGLVALMCAKFSGAFDILIMCCLASIWILKQSLIIINYAHLIVNYLLPTFSKKGIYFTIHIHVNFMQTCVCSYYWWFVGTGLSGVRKTLSFVRYLQVFSGLSFWLFWILQKAIYIV